VIDPYQFLAEFVGRQVQVSVVIEALIKRLNEELDALEKRVRGGVEPHVHMQETAELRAVSTEVGQILERLDAIERRGGGNQTVTGWVQTKVHKPCYCGTKPPDAMPFAVCWVCGSCGRVNE